MKTSRSAGLFLLACAAICLIVAIQKYQSAVTTAKRIAEQFDGMEFESVATPQVSVVMGFVGAVLLVAGIRLLFEVPQPNPPTDDLIDVPRRP